MNLKTLFVRVGLAIVFIAVILILFFEVNNNIQSPPPPVTPDPGLPIDSSILLLFLIGIIIGIRVLKRL